MDGALAFDVGSQPRLRRTRGQPADERTNEEDDKTTDERGDQQSGFDGHQYRTLRTVAWFRGSGLGTFA